MIIKTDKNSDELTIEMTPMIDMVFLLLTFFLVATTFQQVEHEMQIALPKASASGPISANLRELVINVDLDGKIHVGGRQIEVDALRTIITNAVATNPDQKVAVRGDRNTAYANIVRVLDVCKAEGVQQPYLDTVLTD